MKNLLFWSMINFELSKLLLGQHHASKSNVKHPLSTVLYCFLSSNHVVGYFFLFFFQINFFWCFQIIMMC
jgi:hypothetical protein